MPSFLCPLCGAECLDSPTGYRTGGPHHSVQRHVFLANIDIPTIIAGGLGSARA